MPARFSLFAIFVSLFACSKAPPAFTTREISHVASPAGGCVASVVVFDGSPGGSNTQVLLSFDGGKCGSGAVSFDRADVPLELRWLDATTLEVRHPKDATPIRNASGEFLQCFDRKVHVILSAV
jgi:hypothetical protein